MRRRKLQEIAVEPSDKDLPVGDLGLVAFTCFELHFTFQVNVAAGEKTKLDVLIHRSYGQPKLRMSYQDLVRRLSCHDEGRDHFVDLMELLSGEVDTFSGADQRFRVLAVCKMGIIALFMRNSTTGTAFITSVTDIRSPVDPVAALFYEVLAMVVTGRAGGTLDVTEDDLSADIGFVTVEAFGAEVLRVIEETFTGVILREPVLFDLL